MNFKLTLKHAVWLEIELFSAKRFTHRFYEIEVKCSKVLIYLVKKFFQKFSLKPFLEECLSDLGNS